MKKRVFRVTVKVLKFLTLYSILFWSKFLLLMQLFLKLLSGMANSIDPDQTTPSGAIWSGLHCLHMPFCQKFWNAKF